MSRTRTVILSVLAVPSIALLTGHPAVARQSHVAHPLASTVWSPAPPVFILTLIARLRFGPPDSAHGLRGCPRLLGRTVGEGIGWRAGRSRGGAIRIGETGAEGARVSSANPR